MASGRSYTTEDVLDEIFADPDSDFQSESSESEDESYVRESESEDSSEESSDNEDLSENDIQINNPIPPRGRSNTRGNTRGNNHGHSRGQAQRRPRKNKDEENARLELQWSQNDRDPVVHAFTAQSGLQVQLPNNASVIDFLTLFLIDEFLIFW